MGLCHAEVEVCWGKSLKNHILPDTQVISANDSSQLVLNEGNSDATFLTEFVGYYLTIDAGTVSGPFSPF